MKHRFMAGAFSCLAAGMLFLTPVSKARAADGEMVPALPRCLFMAADAQKIPRSILAALMLTEGGHPGTEMPNRDGSHDLGVMQVNDRTWLNKVAYLLFDGDRAKARRELRDNGCLSLAVGAWIFRGYVDEAGGDYARAVGYYNSHTPVHMAAYQQRVRHNFVKLSQLMDYYRKGG
ncbi:lytic transglycosylase domain-containing protein [Komagataeibacter sp. FNDCR1]|nr:lytic transglycosylase domain-containing protein [Komagataeibacter sp. FNDCR1]